MQTLFRFWNLGIEQIGFHADMLGVGSFRTIDDALFADLSEAQARTRVADQLAETVSNGSLLGQVEEILGEDSVPDAAFFVDSWTVGVAVASENLRRRQEEQKIREREIDVRNSFLFPPFFVANDEIVSEIAWRVREVTAQEDSETDSSNPGEEREELRVGDEIQMVRPLTLDSACRVLGVEATSTKERIRAAYRKLAIRHHPDRLSRVEPRERKLASDRMAYLNEAYHFLSAALAGQRSASCR